MMGSFVEVMETIGSIVGVLLTLITFFGVVSKKPKDWFRKIIRDESTAANQPIVEKLDKVEKRMEDADQTDLALIRNTITHIYMKYCEDKKIPHYEKENILYLYEQYTKLKGNSYIKEVVDTIKTWEEIF